MKIKVTKKYINERFGNRTIKIRYCQLQNLLEEFQRPTYYIASKNYGWQCDVYIVDYDGVAYAIVTGYTPFGAIEPDSDLVREFNRKAGQLDYFLEKDNLLNEFMKTVTREV